MKTLSIIGILFLLFSTIALSLPDYADAARMGGGRSFGSRPSMSQTARQPSRTQQPMAQSATQASKPGGLFGGMGGGLLGGLLAGTLLGSLLGGGGFSGGGFLDIIILAVLAYLGYKLFIRSRSKTVPQPAGGAMMRHDSGFNDSSPFARNSLNNTGWNNLSDNNYATSAQPSIDIPADFDTEEFLRGAKAAYTRMQSSWDKRDLNDIAQFATPAVMQELKAQCAADPHPSHTEIMMINAQLVGVEDEGMDRRAQVYFDVLMRENVNQQVPNSAREIWHFLRSGTKGNWKLDGIQQVE